ncbi:unnamed protein product [Cuscuta europaea]|uniref:Uncharacterized protein n=1 Tax=Cuscuta europaea TaxID=41803 RepID=A0A9P0Z780_CUSEU|nr:unnamed protein product [Cuscuta europaea]
MENVNYWWWIACALGYVRIECGDNAPVSLRIFRCTTLMFSNKSLFKGIFGWEIWGCYRRFAGPTLSGSPGFLLPSSAGPVGRREVPPLPTSFASLGQGMGFGASSITTIVTIKLVVVEDYLP